MRRWDLVGQDRFLVCMTHELGYGKWDELKREVRRAPDFRFDWLFKSRTPIELGRRVDLLVRLILNETKEKEPRGKKSPSVVQNASHGLCGPTRVAPGRSPPRGRPISPLLNIQVAARGRRGG